MKIVRHDLPLGQYVEVFDRSNWFDYEMTQPISLRVGRTSSYEELSVLMTPQMARELGQLLIDFADSVEKEPNADQT